MAQKSLRQQAQWMVAASCPVYRDLPTRGHHMGFIFSLWEMPEFDIKPPLGAPSMILPRGYLLKSFPQRVETQEMSKYADGKNTGHVSVASLQQCLGKQVSLQKVSLPQTDTTVINPVISPEADGGQIHLNVVSLMISTTTNCTKRRFVRWEISYREHVLAYRHTQFKICCC